MVRDAPRRLTKDGNAAYRRYSPSLKHYCEGSPMPMDELSTRATGQPASGDPRAARGRWPLAPEMIFGSDSRYASSAMPYLSADPAPFNPVLQERGKRAACINQC
jgi:hypothetical protein